MHAELTLPLATLFGFLMVLARVAGALAFVPLPGFQTSPGPVRAILALSLTIALAPLWPVAPPPELSMGRMLALIASESVLGLTIGLAVAFLLETLMVAAQIFGMQAGYSYATTIDPASGNDSNVLLVFAQLLGGMLFFALGVDRQVMRVFAMSLAAYPPGTFFLKPSAADAMVKLGAGMLATGVRLALPVIVLLMLVDVALALLGRMQQQMQLLTLAFPAKMLATLAFLAAILVLFLPVCRAAAEHTVSALLRLL
jgi:flagellar biosynthetic protein FliR